MTQQVGNMPDENDEQVKKLRAIQKQLEEKIHELLGIEVTEKGEQYDSDYTFFIMISHDGSGLAAFTGNGCPVCATGRTLQWCIENDIRHEENGLPLMIPVMRMPANKTPKSEIN